MYRSAIFATVVLFAAPAWAEQGPTPEERAAQALFSGAADFYEQIGRVLNDGWSYLALREEQRIWMVRAAYAAFAGCLQTAAPDETLPEIAEADARERSCAELVVLSLEEVLGPARWADQLSAVHRAAG